MKKFKFNKISIVTVLAIALVLGFTGPGSAQAATAPTLGTTSTYGIVSSTYTNSLNTDLETKIVGDVCYTTPPDTAPISINGVTVTPLSEAVVPCTNGAAQATALATLNSQSCTSLGTDVVLSGIYTPGCYSSSGAMDIVATTTVTLNGPGVYIFRSGGALTTGANSIVALTGGASAADVFWTPSGTATLGANAATSATPTFVGTIIADALGSTGITLGHFANLEGRVLAFGHTVTTDSNTITVPTVSTLATLHVIKTVVNDDREDKSASDFTLSVKNSSDADVSGSPADGAEDPGTSYTLAAGTYIVSEVEDSSYTQSISGDCDENGSITLVEGEDYTCTITNDDIHHSNSSSGSIPRVVVPVFEPTITILSTPVVLAPIIPKLPRTGFAPQESVTWYQSLLNNILNLFR